MYRSLIYTISPLSPCQEKANPTWLKVWLLDMQSSSPHGGAVTVLMAAVNPQASNQMRYALGGGRLIDDDDGPGLGEQIFFFFLKKIYSGTLSVRGEAPPLRFRSFCVLKHTALWEEAEEAASSNGAGGGGGKLFGYRLVLAGAAFAYVYNRETIMCFSGQWEQWEKEEKCGWGWDVFAFYAPCFPKFYRFFFLKIFY